MDKDNNIKNKKRMLKHKSSSKKITNIDAVRKKYTSKKTKKKDSINFYYSFLTIILLICLVQISFSAILNISKTIVYNNKIVKIRKIRNDAEKKNKALKREIKEFSSTASLEAIARNNLKMAGEDEVLIIINDNNNEENVDATKKKKKGIFR